MVLPDGVPLVNVLVPISSSNGHIAARNRHQCARGLQVSPLGVSLTAWSTCISSRSISHAGAAEAPIAVAVAVAAVQVQSAFSNKLSSTALAGTAGDVTAEPTSSVMLALGAAAAGSLSSKPDISNAWCCTASLHSLESTVLSEPSTV